MRSLADLLERIATWLIDHVPLWSRGAWDEPLTKEPFLSED